MKVTEPVGATSGDTKFVAPLVMVIVFVPKEVEESEQVEIPESSVEEHAPKELLEPVAVKPTVCPLMGSPEQSLAVIVMVEVLAPSATTGPLPEMVEVDAQIVCDEKSTVPVGCALGEKFGVLMVTVFVPELEALSRHWSRPDESVFPEQADEGSI